MDKQTARSTAKWKLWLVGGAIVGGGALTISAGDSFFEISKNLEIFTELYKELNIYYVDDTQPGKLMKTGIDAMLNSLDPYTQYIPESDMEDYRFMTTGQYGGIGALIKRQDDHVLVSEPYEGYPAMKAGIWAGDEIVEVDGRKIAGMETDEVSKLLKGQAGSTVNIVTKRGDAAPTTHALTREEIKIPDVPYKGMIDSVGMVGYIKLNSFTQTAGQEVRNAMKELKDQGAKKMVLDLRGNGGGLLREAVNIVNLFVPKNQLVVETKGRIPEWDKTYNTLSEPLDATIPLAVLVDGGSASASEIVSGALQDLDRGVIIGERSYGKGLVQQTRDLYYNSKLKVTVAKYYIPSGRCIQKLDYASRDSSGKVAEVKEEAIAEFKTRNGRPVFDGRGILPDIEVTDPELAKVVGGLYSEDLFFDFATRYRSEHADIGPAERFTISDALYQEFTDYVKDKKFEYDTETMEAFKALEEKAKKERYYDHAKAQLEALHAELAPDRTEELTRFRSDIEEVLKSEIVARYHYQTGRAKASLVTDPYIKESIAVLNGPRYNEVLTTVKPGK
ncbi:MAG: S41 family peptidase [Flavobacteriales bacterium]|nr:S41 family peptidase [Flavobacteriales bacterium]HRH68053.1 S41 family peptidase [Flavobacteriales bacterium]